MMTLRVLVDGQAIEEFTVPWFKITDKSIERYIMDFAKRHKISQNGVRIVPVEKQFESTSYNKHQVRK